MTSKPSHTATPNPADAHSATGQPSMRELLRLVEEQRSELAALRRTVNRISTGHTDSSTTLPVTPAAEDRTPTSKESSTDRRRFLRRAGLAGAVAGAAIGATATARPAAAADGEAVTIGDDNVAQSTTTLVGPPSTNGNIFTVGDNETESDQPAAIGAFAQGDEVDHGLYAFSASGHAIIARASSNAQSSILMTPTADNPTVQLREHEVGEVIADIDGNLWHCVASGNPGSFRQLSGPATAGSLTPINPIRVYDARFGGNGTGDFLSTGDNRLIPVRDELSLTTGRVLTNDVIPPGTFAVAYNVAAFKTEGTGFLYVAPADNTDVTAATVNWSETAPGPISNASIVKVEQDRQVRVFCGGAAPASCLFTIDIVGYYR